MIKKKYFNYFKDDYLHNFQRGTAFLNGHFIDAGKGKFFPLLLKDSHYEIKEALINGKSWKKIDRKNGSIKLPAKGGYDMVVRVQKNTDK